MNKIRLSASNDNKVTIISNTFIDTFMTKAKPLYVKIYIYMLRCMTDNDTNISIASIADNLDETEGDVLRALTYWESVKLISVTRDTENHITGITFYNPDDVIPRTAPVEVKTPNTRPVLSVVSPDKPERPATVKPNYSPSQINQLSEIPEVRGLFDQVELTLGRPLKPSEVQLVLYLYEELEMSADLIAYLYSYCVMMNKRSVSYLEAVAHSWIDQGIKTVAQAQTACGDYLQSNRCVAKAFGIRRSLSSVEQDYVKHWFYDMAFTEALIENACSRTILAISNPDFKYTNSILENWYNNGVKNMSDVARLDAIHEINKSKIRDIQSKSFTNERKKSNNQFNAFPQRAYTEDEYLSMEQRLLNRK